MQVNTLKPIANAINAGEYYKARRLIRGAIKRESSATWRTQLRSIIPYLFGNAPGPQSVQHSILRPGNSKLGHKFLAFSTLPATEVGGVGCPGAGECVEFCYSRKAWRYPAAFARQAKNTALMQSASGRELIAAALDKLAPKYPVFRLYVDGDFSARPAINGWNDFDWWMLQLSRHPMLQSYGYSKSIHMVNSAKFIPTNYRLNLSSGMNASAQAAAVEAADLYAVRGWFLGVDTVPFNRTRGHGDPAHRRALVAAHKLETGRKAFACPGKCNTCTPAGHACASPRFNDIDIIISIH